MKGSFYVSRLKLRAGAEESASIRKSNAPTKKASVQRVGLISKSGLQRNLKLIRAIECFLICGD